MAGQPSKSRGQSTRGKSEPVDREWVTFPGGELEGKRRKSLCPAGRAGGNAQVSRTLCFQCYRLQLRRDRAIEAAGTVFTGSEERFQFGLPFEPVNKGRLALLRSERLQAKAESAARSRLLN